MDDDHFVVDRVDEDVSWCCYSTLLLKSDNEPAIGNLVRESCKALRVDCQIDQANEERADPNDHQSNGNAELVAITYKSLIVICGATQLHKHQ